MKRTIPFLITLIKQGSLVKQIIAGLVLGILVALAFPGFAQGCGVLGSFFVSALKAVAPVLVFVLVAASIANQESTTNTAMKDVIVLYLVGTFLAALVAVFASFLFPTQIALIDTKDALSAPGGIGEVVKNLIFNIVDNPVKAIANANYIGILAWSISLGVALRYASDETKRIVTDLTASVEYVVRFVIRLAPIGVFGLVAEVVATVPFLIARGERRKHDTVLQRYSAHCYRLHDFHCFDRQSAFGLPLHPQESLSFGLGLPERKRCDSLLHTFFCCEHSCEHEPLP